QGQNLPSFKEELKAYEAQIVKSSVDEPQEVELKDLPHHLEYAFLKGDNKLLVIIAKELGSEEKAALIKVLKSHNPWVSPVHYVPKKGGFTVVENEENELIPTRLVTGWRTASPGTFKFPLTLVIKKRQYSPAHMALLPTAACLSAYAMLRMEEDFTPAVQHQRRVNPKIYDVIKQEVIKLLDAGLIYPIFDSHWVSLVHCVPKKGGITVVENEDNELIPTRLVTGKMLKRCEDTNLCLNWEKSHFMVKEGIVLGHKISKKGIEVDKAKVDVISKLPHPTTVKAPDWDMPFELMCDASDFAIGAVLGQRQDKYFRPIHYASKTMTEAESKYTTTEKEMLAVVFLLPMGVTLLMRSSAMNPPAHIISPLEYDCFYFRNFPNPGELTSSLNSEIRENLSSTTCMNLQVEDDYSPLLAYVVWIFLTYLTYPVIPPHLQSFRNEDTIFDPCITINRFYSFKAGLSHRCRTFKKFNTHRSHLNGSPMEMLFSTLFPMEK
nr:hypothetical protein [Tanacetum cinerariifolium]